MQGYKRRSGQKKGDDSRMEGESEAARARATPMGLRREGLAVCVLRTRAVIEKFARFARTLNTGVRRENAAFRANIERH